MTSATCPLCLKDAEIERLTAQVNDAMQGEADATEAYRAQIERLRAALRRAGVEAMGCSPAASSEFKTEALNSVIAICAAADQGYDVRGEVETEKHDG